MEEQRPSLWPILTIIVIVAVAIIAGLYFYPREQRLAANLSGSDDLLPAGANTNQTASMSTQTSGQTLVTLKTNQGDITLELYPAKAPKTVDNFIKLAKAGFYNGTLFHRVIKGFMIQGGDPLTKSQPKDWAVHGTGGPGYQFADEQNDIRLERGVLAMANSGPNTNGSQFFIMTARQALSLQGYYTPFGRVVTGMETVDKIETTPVNSNDHPLADMLVESVEVK